MIEGQYALIQVVTVVDPENIGARHRIDKDVGFDTVVTIMNDKCYEMPQGLELWSSFL